MNPPGWLLAAAEDVFNRMLALDAHATRRARSFAGRGVGLEILGLDMRVLMRFEPTRVRFAQADVHETAEAWIRGGPFSLLRTGLTEDRTALRDGDVVIEGDLELGHAVQRMLRGLDVDWEEQLSRVAGDPIAFQLASAWRRLRTRARRNVNQTARDATDYLRDEWRALPFTHEAERWYDDVDRLRGDTDRLAQRLKMLESREKGRAG